jgi:hypothetical protein
VLIAADNALKSAIETVNWRSKSVDKNFEEAIHLLSRFEKDFSSKDLPSNSNIGGTATGKAKMNYKSESPSAILYTLKNHFHVRVTFPPVSLHLNADDS